jgi:hypothetical protein
MSTHIISGSSYFAPAYVYQSQKIRGSRLPMYFNPRSGRRRLKKGSPKAPDLSAAVQDHQAQHQYAD